MPRLYNNLSFEYKDNEYILYSKYLYLHSDYNTIYDMSYITPEIVKNKLPLISLINIHFATSSMIKYFGSMMNLNCNETRLMYKNMNEYFINLFLKRVFGILNVDINTLNEVDDNSCLIAECLNIIRSDVRKYSRVRTSKNQLLCTKESLNINNSKRYECRLPITDYE
jgi:hypothetical protein